MTTTTYGYLNPSTGDLSKGTTGWMAAYNFNVARFDGHTHNGYDSAQLTPASLSSLTVTASSSNWTTNSGGTGLPSAGYYQTITVPNGVSDISNFSVSFRFIPTGATLYVSGNFTFVRVTATTFNLYSIDNTISILCIFR